MKETKDCFLGLLSDDSDWLAELGFFLQRSHFKTAGVSNLNQARQLIGLTSPDLIITDNLEDMRALASKSFQVLFASQSTPLRTIRDQVIKRLFPSTKTQKRFYKRIPVKHDAFMELPVLEGQFLNATVVNISRRGVFVMPKEILPEKDDVVKLEFTCLEEELFTFEALGIVRWTRYASEPEGFGVEFVSLTEASTDYLLALCRPVFETKNEPGA